MSKNIVEKFIEQLLSNKVNKVVRIGKAITEPLSDTARTYFENWYAQTDSARYAQFNHDSMDWGYAGITPPPRPEYPVFIKWLSVQLEQVTKRDDLMCCFYDHEKEEFNTDDPLYNELALPTVYSERYAYLDDVINTHARNIAKANEKKKTACVRVELEEIKGKFAALLPNTPPATAEPISKPTAPLFKDVIEEYLAFAVKPLPPKHRTAPERHMQIWLLEFAELPINEIYLDHIIEAWSTFNNFPKNTKSNGNPYANLSLDERWGVASSDPIDPIYCYGWEAAKKYKQELRKFFTWCVDIKRISNHNPLASDGTYKLLKDHKDRSTPRTKFPFPIAQKIIHHCESHLENPYHWAILLMAYHGMRNAEVTNLTKTDVITDSETSIPYLYIRKGKTANANRKIPIHHTILNLGFLDFVDRATDKIFNFKTPYLTAYYFHELRPLLDLPSEDVDGSRLSLYSFRHTVISQLTSTDVNRGKQNALVGHASSEVQAGYTHIDLPALQYAINKVAYL